MGDGCILTIEGHTRNEVTVLVRIAICDDEKEAVTLHEEIIKDSLQSCGIGYEITTYTYSNNLLSDITEDELMLLTSMRECNGIKKRY